MATVDEQIANANARIDQLIEESAQFVSALKAFTDVGFNLPPAGNRSFSIITGTGLADAIQAQPPRPVGLNFGSSGNVSAPPTPVIREAITPVLPDAPQDSPEVNIPAAPAVVFPTAPTSPQIEPVATPVPPDFVLPSVPVLAPITLPTAQSVNLPTFDAVFPDDNLAFNPASFNFVEPDFVDELMDEIKQQTLDDLRNGGFGIDPRDEDQLVGRLRDREARAGRTQEKQVLRNFASRGHRMPHGSLEDALAVAQQETQGRISAGEREIYVTRADLFRKTREFQLQNGLTLEGLLVNIFGFRQERALKAAIFTSEFSIAIFDALVRQFNTRVQAYLASVQAHETLVRAEIAKVEIFKAEIEAQRLVSDINTQEVAVYTAQVDAVQAVVNIFETEMKAAQIANDIQRLKIAQFSEEVNAFNALINAEGTKINVFEAQIKGEVAKLGVFQTQVQTYEAEVRAAATKTQIENINVQTDIERSRLDLQTYLGEIDQFKANLSQEVERIRSVVNVYEADISSFRALIDGWTAFYNSADRNTAMFLDLVNSNAQRDQQQTQIELQRLISQTSIQLDATARGVTLYENLIQAAQSANNALTVKEDTT